MFMLSITLINLPLTSPVIPVSYLYSAACMEATGSTAATSVSLLTSSRIITLQGNQLISPERVLNSRGLKYRLLHHITFFHCSRIFLCMMFYLTSCCVMHHMFMMHHS
jgi:hypothetical protein